MKTIKSIGKLKTPDSLIAAGLPHRILWREFDDHGSKMIECVIANRTECLGRSSVRSEYLEPGDALQMAIAIWRDEVAEEEMLLEAEAEAQRQAELADQEHAGAKESYVVCNKCRTEASGQYKLGENCGLDGCDGFFVKVCEHPVDKIKYVASLAAPGHGHSYKCGQCGEALWGNSAEMAVPFKDLDEGDYIMSEADVR